jgi:hypothetical protein
VARRGFTTDSPEHPVMRLIVRVGQGCARLHDRLMRDLQVNLIELDEQWDFIGKKQRHVKQGDLDEAGDVWLFVALAATQKAVLSYVVGKRTAENKEALTLDLIARKSRQTGMRLTSGQSRAHSAGTSITPCSQRNTQVIRACLMPRIATPQVMSPTSIRP